MAYLKGWKYIAFISAFVGGIGLATYPIIIYPMMNIEEYSKFELKLNLLKYLSNLKHIYNKHCIVFV